MVCGRFLVGRIRQLGRTQVPHPDPLPTQGEGIKQERKSEDFDYRPKSWVIAASDSGSVSDGAWPTPGTSMLVAPRRTWHIRVAVARGRMSLSAPRTIRVGHAM